MWWVRGCRFGSVLRTSEVTVNGPAGPEDGGKRNTFEHESARGRPPQVKIRYGFKAVPVYHARTAVRGTDFLVNGQCARSSPVHSE
eukprot:3294158-Prymnesium_polylepis.1